MSQNAPLREILYTTRGGMHKRLSPEALRAEIYRVIKEGQYKFLDFDADDMAQELILMALRMKRMRYGWIANHCCAVRSALRRQRAREVPLTEDLPDPKDPLLDVYVNDLSEAIAAQLTRAGTSRNRAARVLLLEGETAFRKHVSREHKSGRLRKDGRYKKKLALQAIRRHALRLIRETGILDSAK